MRNHTSIPLLLLVALVTLLSVTSLVISLRQSPSPATHSSSSHALATLQKELRELQHRVAELEREKGALAIPTESAPSAEDPDGLREQLAALEKEIRTLRKQSARPAPTTPRAELYSFQGKSNPEEKGWDFTQALGPPDTLTVGDHQTAWAPLAPNGGTEWIELEFAELVRPKQILIRQTFNPGAITRVEAIAKNGTVRLVASEIENGHSVDLILPYEMKAAIRRLRIELDTTLVPGWNEIDAVGLITANGVIWAESAVASTTYADRTTQPNEIQPVKPYDFGIKRVDF